MVLCYSRETPEERIQRKLDAIAHLREANQAMILALLNEYNRPDVEKRPLITNISV